MSTSPSAIFMPRSVTPQEYKHFAVFATRDWYHAVGEAVTRSGEEGLLRRVYAAESALFHRWTGMTDSEGDQKERQAMELAARKLWEIKTYILGWPGL
jgi:hypothetical protein